MMSMIKQHLQERSMFDMELDPHAVHLVLTKDDVRYLLSYLDEEMNHRSLRIRDEIFHQYYDYTML